MFVVKKAITQQELDAILKLRVKILRDPWNQPAESATDSMEPTSLNAYIADEQGTVIACARLQENENKKGQVRFMAVDTAYQGKGLGKLVMAFIEQEAKHMQLQVIELQARENALDFYKSCGYAIKEKTFLLWGQIQHYLMEKNITSVSPQRH